MASSKGVALAFLLLLALELTSIPSSSAQKEKGKQCSKAGANWHCKKTWDQATKGKEKIGEGAQRCCKYLKEFDASEAASCLCNVVQKKDKEKENIADSFIRVLKACEIHYPIPTTYKCSKQ